MSLRANLRKLKIASIISLCVPLILLTLASTSLFRLKLAEHLVKKHQYKKAISVYKKALRKEKAKEIQSRLKTSVQSRLDAITLLLKTAYFEEVEYHFKQAEYYFKLGTLNFKLLDNAMAEHEGIYKLYEDYQQAFPLISEDVNNQWRDILKENDRQRTEKCFVLGQQYVRKQM